MTVAIVAILAALALPGYRTYLQKSRRVDGQAALERILAEQVRWRVNNTSFTTTLSNLGISSASSDSGYYTMSIPTASATGYTAQVTAVSTGPQASDTACTTMSITMTSGNPTYSPATCWSK